MKRTGIPIIFLDVKKSREDKLLNRFLSKRVYINNIGAVYGGRAYTVNPLINSLSKMVLKDTFDGIVFIETTSEALRTKPKQRLGRGEENLGALKVFMGITVGMVILGFGLFI